MKVLIVASYNKGFFAPFIIEQVNAVRCQNIECEYFGIEGKGFVGYLSNLKRLKRKISEFHPDVIHAHYSLSGLLANLQRRIPVVTTYHGSDINDPKVFKFSKLCMRLSKFNIFVSKKNADASGLKEKFIVQPCGIDVENFSERTKQDAKLALGWKEKEKYVVFAGAFDNEVKNAPLAKEAISKIENVKLIELKGFSRENVANVFYASDALLMTSFTEGSPQVIKEAMACGCPIVSVDAGDVADIIKGVDGCYISKRDADEVAQNLNLALSFCGRTKGRERIIELGLTNEMVAGKILEIYKGVVNDNTEK